MNFSQKLIFSNSFKSSKSWKTFATMVQAKWNGAVIAEANDSDCVKVDGNFYFPKSAIKEEYFKPNSQTSTCGWKGTCNYFDIVVDGKTNAAACWVYQEPKKAAENIKGHYAFWKGVQVA